DPPGPGGAAGPERRPGRAHPADLLAGVRPRLGTTAAPISPRIAVRRLHPEERPCSTSTRTNYFQICPVFQGFFDGSRLWTVFFFHCFHLFRPNSVQPVLAVIGTSIAPVTSEGMPKGGDR